MIERHIETTKTGRYFVLGTAGETTESVWFVCHGYGQLARDFLKDFKPLDNGKTMVVAPEGLHRYYIHGFSGRVGASWMTREDRLNDIKDYIRFLDRLYENVMSDYDGRKVRTIALGFSQGTATAARWVCAGNSRLNHLILWGGGLPEDTDIQTARPILNRLDFRLVYGQTDPFLPGEIVHRSLDIMTRNHVKYQHHPFPGSHEIPPEALLTLERRIHADYT